MSKLESPILLTVIELFESFCLNPEIFENQQRLVYYKRIAISWLVEVAQRWLEAQSRSDARDKSTEPQCIALLVPMLQKTSKFLSEAAIHRASRIEDQVCDTRCAIIQ